MNTVSLIKRGLPIELRGVSKSFAGRTVIDSLNLTLEAGQFVAVVGRSGCGKSTLLRLLAGLEQASQGEISAGQRPLVSAAQDIRMMFQDSRLLPWKTVLDNVGLGLRGQWRDEAMEVLDAVGLADRAGEWPSALSGGQRQRVALARALIHRPQVLLLDEPLGALDALTRLEMQQLLTKLWQRHQFTVVLVTHDVHEAVFMADRVLLIDKGRVGLDLAVDLARPRRLAAAEMARIEDELLAAIMGESAGIEDEVPVLRVGGR
ncbi:aliphatic sulfonates import ATP-binding protein SsuB [Salmonella enterica subsp. enterica serovar Choleraesuis]|nr:aliphatic sulfonates import ATP-binding protein SsuB [Salmonella enterica subsp. enterica serovar Choleraesuis]